MPVVSDPRVQYAIRKSYERRARQKARAAVAEALEREGAATVRELVEITGLDREAVCEAAEWLRCVSPVRADFDEETGLIRWVA